MKPHYSVGEDQTNIKFSSLFEVARDANTLKPLPILESRPNWGRQRPSVDAVVIVSAEYGTVTTKADAELKSIKKRGIQTYGAISIRAPTNADIYPLLADYVNNGTLSPGSTVAIAKSGWRGFLMDKRDNQPTMVTVYSREYSRTVSSS